ncbi:cadmium resistance transporter [Streptococcus halotolerans]|uniref:cadmium resistance transporter n=1 Tax=Streptococcus halotolerans TaxID=1814128 RepID=UPI000786D0B5|nr:cadmium resistance transporter [Streptococcus halotolerans]
MLQTIMSALAVFVSTSIDYVVLLFIIFASLGRKQFVKVLTGQYIGISLLVIVSLLIAYLFRFIPEDWMIGLLGFIPIALGIRYAFYGEAEEDDEAVKTKLDNEREVLLAVTTLTIASGADNLGVYIPYFAGLSWDQLTIALLIFIVATFLLNWTIYQVADNSWIADAVERVEKRLLPLVLIGLGLYLLIENGTVSHLLNIG